MNEICGPLFYVLATDPDPEWRAHAEADTFFCFASLMTVIRDNFIKTLDKSDAGINHRMGLFAKTLQKVDPAVHANLERKRIVPEFYAFRWLTLMLSQEFQLPDVIRMWDTLFADIAWQGRPHNSPEFLIYICVAMLVHQRDAILAADFGDTLKLLQNYPETDLQVILHQATMLRD
eukprot:Colp12_sorted_trinity150504_noHs@17583